MNLIDLGIIAVLGIGFILGWYKGFLTTALNLASYAAAWLISLIFYKPLASFMLAKTNFDNTLLYLTAGAEKLSDMSVANVDVNTLGKERVTEIISTSNLPKPIENMILDNILNNAFASQGISTLSDYFNQTLINLSVSLISFLIIFLAVRLICMFLIGLLDFVTKLPVLKQCDKAIGGACGVLQAAVIVAIIFAVIPIAMSVLPFDNFNTMVQSSFFGKLFFNHNIIFNILRSVL